MTHRLDAVLSPVDLPAAELSAARLDGELFSIADRFTPVDLPESATSRAQALAQELSARMIVEMRSAAWVLGATAVVPVNPEFCSRAEARAKPAAIRRLAVREVVIEDDEILCLGGVRVTSPLRTASDLIRSSPDFGVETQLVVLRLLEIAQSSVGECAALLDGRRNLPGKRRALERLASISVAAEPQVLAAASAVADAVDVVNGVDAPHRIQDAVEVGGVPHLEYELAQR